ncbi:MAG: RNA-directed DNA polymerase [Paludibacter sp.]|nr:RNA-directed DNA polymerase [Paludibacter sp.]
MKRTGNLIEKIADIDNLYLAFYKAAKSKCQRREVIDYRQRLDRNIAQLHSEILSGNMQVGNYHYFKIYDPKERIICAAAFAERVLHHALMNVCHANFEKYQIFHSYASRVGKGTYAALQQASVYQKKYAWFLKLDVRKYFDNINHEILKNMLRKRFKDEKLLILFDKIINSYNSQFSISNSQLKGLPIGNLTSQYFANHYLAVADHFVTENLCILAYVRYMDDMVIWGNNKNELLLLGKNFQNFVEENLNLELKPFCLNSCEKGLQFLGYRLYKNHTQLSNQSKKRFTGKFKQYYYYLNNGLWNENVYQSHILPLLAFANHADTKNLRKKLLEN